METREFDPLFVSIRVRVSFVFYGNFSFWDISSTHPKSFRAKTSIQIKSEFVLHTYIIRLPPSLGQFAVEFPCVPAAYSFRNAFCIPLQTQLQDSRVNLERRNETENVQLDLGRAFRQDNTTYVISIHRIKLVMQHWCSYSPFKKIANTLLSQLPNEVLSEECDFDLLDLNLITLEERNTFNAARLASIPNLFAEVCFDERTKHSLFIFRILYTLLRADQTCWRLKYTQSPSQEHEGIRATMTTTIFMTMKNLLLNWNRQHLYWE